MTLSEEAGDLPVVAGAAAVRSRFWAVRPPRRRCCAASEKGRGASAGLALRLLRRRVPETARSAACARGVRVRLEGRASW